MTRHSPGRRRTLQGLALTLAPGLLAGVLAGVPKRVHAQGVELASVELARREGALVLDFAARLSLSPAVEDAMQRGVPVYFVARATLYRSRWYWRDERVARVTRTWRVAYQPLTSTWRVGLGGLNQTLPNMAEALAIVSRSSGWKLAELGQIEPDSSHYVEFEYRLDTSQLPGPMQIGLSSQSDWTIRVERRLRVDG